MIWLLPLPPIPYSFLFAHTAYKLTTHSTLPRFSLPLLYSSSSHSFARGAQIPPSLWRPLGKNVPDPRASLARSPFPATSTNYPSGMYGGEAPDGSRERVAKGACAAGGRAGTRAGSSGRAPNAFSARPPRRSLSRCRPSGERRTTGGRAKLPSGPRSAGPTEGGEEAGIPTPFRRPTAAFWFPAR